MNTYAWQTRVRARLYSGFRSYMHETPWLFHVMRSVRFTAMVGPWRPWLIRYHQWRNGNERLDVNEQSLFPEFDPVTGVESLHRDGIALGLRLPEDIVSEIVEFAGPPGSRWGDVLGDCAAIQRVARDPKLIDLTRRYLGVEPIILDSRILYTTGGHEPQHANTFHFDVSDYSSLTVFFYLSDVDGDSGPHVVIRGTHKRKTALQLAKLYLKDDIANRKYGDRIQTIKGPKGSGFAEELTIFHKANLAKKPRLAFSICYTLRRKVAPCIKE